MSRAETAPIVNELIIETFGCDHKQTGGGQRVVNILQCVVVKIDRTIVEPWW